MRKIIFALLVAALALVAIVAAGTGGASTQSPKAASTALVTCGKSRTLGRFTCASRTTGLTCRDRRSGHGFEVSRQRQRLF